MPDSATMGLVDGTAVLKKLADMRLDRRDATDTVGVEGADSQSSMLSTSSKPSPRTRSGPREVFTGPSGAEMSGRCSGRLGMGAARSDMPVNVSSYSVFSRYYNRRIATVYNEAKSRI